MNIKALRSVVSVIALQICVSGGPGVALAANAAGRVHETVTSRTATLSYTTRVLLSTRQEVQTIHLWTERLQAGDRSVCLGYRDTDMSGCAAKLAQAMRLQSADGLRAMLDLIVAAAVKDRELGFDDRRVSLKLADTFLSVAETLEPQSFFVHVMPARNSRERADQKITRLEEDKKLESFRALALPSVESHLEKTENLSLNSEPLLLGLRQRLTKLRARRWSIS